MRKQALKAVTMLVSIIALAFMTAVVSSAQSRGHAHQRFAARWRSVQMPQHREFGHCGLSQGERASGASIADLARRGDCDGSGCPNFAL